MGRIMKYNVIGITDDFVKNPYAVLPFFSRRCGVGAGTEHSSGFGLLASGAFYEAARKQRVSRLLTNLTLM